jgi:hypothetical protein
MALAPSGMMVVAIAVTVSLTPALSRFAGEGDAVSLRDVHAKRGTGLESTLAA